ncbi:hypothetical protein [Auraticoccus cholistanensis]|uniref:hypothetical protein n=1 Tax=Auraticoccus cholistanensis TaxID=2656650 RepID=UPI0018D22D9E|nr:hypothetical protein [Auraticoccus cholistanensis]
MSAPTTWGRFAVVVDDGAVVLLDGGRELLRCTLRPQLDGVLLPVQDVSTAPDEVELGGAGQGLRWRVRHAFSDAWHTRVLLQGERPGVAVESLVWRLGTDRAAWCWGSGVHGLLAVLGPEPELLVTRPLRATLRTGGELGPLQPGPDGTTVTLRTRWETRAEVAGALPAWLPVLERRLEDPLELEHPDAGIVHPEELEVSSTGPLTQLVASRPGCWPVSLHGPEGETVLEPCWASDVEEVVAARAAELVREAPRRQGVPVLTDPASVLVLARGGVGAERDEAVARALAEPAGAGSPWSVLLAVEEHQRSGAAEHLARAVQLLPELTRGAGAPTAAMAVLVALATSGADPSPAAAALARTAGSADTELLLELELLGGRLGPASTRTAAALVDRLGAGLPGGPLAVDPRTTAREVTLLRWLPDEAARALDGRLLGGSSLSELVQRTERRLLAGDPSTEALAWLGTTVLDR